MDEINPEDIVETKEVDEGKIYTMKSGQIITADVKICHHCSLRGLDTCPGEPNGKAYDEELEWEHMWTSGKHFLETCNRAVV